MEGIKNEYEFVKYLNNKRISELNPIFKELINTLFSQLKEDLVINSWKNSYKQKTDIFIKINNQTKRISIKKGTRNSVHVERISDFIHFLIQNKVDREIIIEYLKYHYADGSTNGTGKNRVSVEEYKKDNQSNIDKINNAFNNEKIIKRAIERFVTKGKNSNNHIDAIIYGEIDNFVWATRKEIEEIILSKKDKYSSAVHFGVLTCQPKNRCLNYNPNYEKDRYCVQIKWYNLYEEITEYKLKKETIDKIQKNKEV